MSGKLFNFRNCKKEGNSSVGSWPNLALGVLSVIFKQEKKNVKGHSDPTPPLFSHIFEFPLTPYAILCKIHSLTIRKKCPILLLILG